MIRFSDLKVGEYFKVIKDSKTYCQKVGHFGNSDKNTLVCNGVFTDTVDYAEVYQCDYLGNLIVRLVSFADIKPGQYFIMNNSPCNIYRKIHSSDNSSAISVIYFNKVELTPTLYTIKDDRKEYIIVDKPKILG